jgi:uncharacterized membrane protein YhaH (DUF805 family)
MDIPALFFSTQGRIGRGKWWLGLICIVVVAVVVGSIMFTVLQTRMYYTMAGRAVLFVFTLLVLAAAYCLNAKRFQDRNKPQTLALIGLVIGVVKAISDLIGLTGDPWGWNTGDNIFQLVTIAIGLWYIVELGFFRGTAGPNDYGPDPLSNEIPAR